MGFHGSLLRSLTLATLRGAKEYYEIGEAQLTAARKADVERIQAEIRSLGLGMESAYNEWCLERQSHEATHEMLVPNFFRYSFLVLLYLIIENKLKDLCEAMQSMKSLTRLVPTGRKVTVHTYIEYIIHDAGINGLNWEAVYDLNRVRNCIVHASGSVHKRDDEAELREIASRVSGISISGKDSKWIDDLQPLYLEDHMLVLEPQYCRRVASDVEQLFTSICDAIPLAEFSFSSLKEQVREK